MYVDKEFKNIVILTYLGIKKTLENENRNISNTSQEMLDFIEEFEVEIKDRKLYMYCEDEYEIKMCDVVFYDKKNKSFQIKSDEIYHELLSITRTFKKLQEVE